MIDWVSVFSKKGRTQRVGNGSVSIQCGTGDNIGSKVIINGVEYVGDNISVNGNKVVIDGVEQLGSLLPGPINIQVEGDVGSITTTSGNINCGNVGMLSTTSGDIEVSGFINGNINTTSGDIRVGGDIHGNINTISGDIIRGNKQ